MSGAKVTWPGRRGRQTLMTKGVAWAAAWLATGSTLAELRGQEPQAALTRKLVQRVEPVYPPLAVKNDFSGVVILRVIIDPDGHIDDVRPASGNAVLIKAAVEAVRTWRYAPAAEASVAFVQVSFNRDRMR